MTTNLEWSQIVKLQDDSNERKLIIKWKGNRDMKTHES